MFEADFAVVLDRRQHHAVHALSKVGREDIDRELGPSSMAKKRARRGCHSACFPLG